MAIVNALVHHLNRGAEGDSLKLSTGSEALPVNGKTEDLLRDLKSCYIGKAGKSYGQFSPEFADHPFGNWLREHLEGKIGFASLNEKLLQHFKLILEDSAVSLNGQLLIIHESLADSDQCYVFFIEHNEGLYVDGTQQLASSQYLDVSGVRLAAKVNLTEWQQGTGDKHYLSVLRARGDKDLTEAFYKAIGFADKLDIARETTCFLDAVAAYTRALPEEQALETRHKVVEYCTEQDKTGTAVQFEQLSAHINDEKPQAFAEFLEKNLKSPEKKDGDTSGVEPMRTELIPDRNQLRQFVRISGRSDALSMSFTSDCLGDSIVYHADSDSLTINNIPASLKARLLKHMQGQ